MASLGSAASDFFQSILAFISGIFNTIFAVLQSAFAAVRGLVSSIVELLGGIVGFIFGNIAVLAAIAVAIGVYVMWQRRSGYKVELQKKKI